VANSGAKTTATDASVADFLATVPDPRRREEAMQVDAMHRRVTGCAPVMWGPSIVGYGSYRYRYDSGREGAMCRAGFSPRKAAMTIYLIADFAARRAEADALFARLGPHDLGKACLYIKRLSAVDMAALEGLVALNWECMNCAYPD